MKLSAVSVGNGIINYMRTCRSIFNKCRDHFNDVDSGRLLVNHYPFKKYTIPKRTTDARDHVLTLAELRLLINYQPENQGEAFAKDIKDLKPNVHIQYILSRKHSRLLKVIRASNLY